MYCTTNKLYIMKNMHKWYGQYNKQTVCNEQQKICIYRTTSTNCVYSITNKLYILYNKHKMYVVYKKQIYIMYNKHNLNVQYKK